MLVDAPAGISYGRLPTAQETRLKSPRLNSNYHILLVEDNLINQKVLSKQLRSTGSVVHVANHGVEALDFLSKTTLWNDSSSLSGSADNRPPPAGQRMKLSLILMDLEMPIMDGLACTRRIRDLEREGRVLGHVPIIAVTANTRMEQMDQAREAGMVSLSFLLRILLRWRSDLDRMILSPNHSRSQS